MFLVLYVLFAVVFKVGRGVPNYPIYLLTGVMLWTFFGEMTGQSLSSVFERGSLIQKIRIPKWLIVVATTIGALISVFFGFIIVVLFAVIYGMEFHASALLLPLFVAELYIFGLGVSFFLSALYVKYRDIKYIWEVVLQAGFYVTPILYPLSLIENVSIQKLLIVNPIAQSIQGARNVFVTPETLTIHEVFGSKFALLIPIIIVIAVLFFGAKYFKKQSKYFAENL